MMGDLKRKGGGSQKNATISDKFVGKGMSNPKTGTRHRLGVKVVNRGLNAAGKLSGRWGVVRRVGDPRTVEGRGGWVVRNGCRSGSACGGWGEKKKMCLKQFERGDVIWVCEGGGGARVVEDG